MAGKILSNHLVTGNMAKYVIKENIHQSSKLNTNRLKNPFQAINLKCDPGIGQKLNPSYFFSNLLEAKMFNGEIPSDVFTQNLEQLEGGLYGIGKSTNNCGNTFH